MTTQGLRIQYISDLHLEFPRRFELRPSAPYLAILGDLASGHAKSGVILTNFFDCYSPQFEKIFYVAGNHEFYFGTYENILERNQRICSKYPNVHFMHKSKVELPGDWLIAGCTLWSHVPDEFEDHVEICLNDYYRIRSKEHNGQFRVTYTNAIHAQERAFIEACIAEARDEGKKLVILTHHSPYTRSHPQFVGKTQNSAFETDLVDLIRPPVEAWFYGHTHYSRILCFHGVPVLSNQAGYPNERTNNPRRCTGVDCAVWDSALPVECDDDYTAPPDKDDALLRDIERRAGLSS
eukprot:gnl/Trimastix_PCT/4344.p1 GENE.gnl/Trimastix_PCT/4344~~gnl/Trimastix_PCT/4344.p1  ORF type:complete len:309 (+),score=58.49 gnl/Trimastix_PCT/4344:48-929(+)